MSDLKLSAVNKRYPNGYEAIKSADIQVGSGDFTVFVGPSGCGKSTLLRMIAGLEDTSAGKIVLGDRDITKEEPAKRNIAMVFQNYALYPHMTVYKNLAYGLINRKKTKAEIDKRVQEASKLLQLEEYLDRKPSELSGGQRQRVAMGRAIVREPELFLFDEPLSNLDAKLRQKMRVEIKSLQQRLGITAIYVTHDQVEAMTMADQIVVINKGEIEQIDTPQGIYHNPSSLFVATFMGSPPMNILSATVDKGVIRLPDGLDIKLQNLSYEGDVHLGIRPEKIHIAQEKSDSSDVLMDVVVNVSEDLGAHRLIHANLGEAQLSFVSHGKGIDSGERVSVRFAKEDIYLFDKAEGKRLHI